MLTFPMNSRQMARFQHTTLTGLYAEFQFHYFVPVKLESHHITTRMIQEIKRDAPVPVSKILSHSYTHTHTKKKKKKQVLNPTCRRDQEPGP
jgi:hypothetical protein